jgi:hypothetical protein
VAPNSGATGLPLLHNTSLITTAKPTNQATSPFNSSILKMVTVMYAKTYEELKAHDVAKPRELRTHITYRLQKPKDNYNYTPTTPNKIQCNKGLTYRNMSNLSHCYG